MKQKESGKAIEQLANAITESGNQITFGLRPHHIELIEGLAEKYGGYNHHVFKDAGKFISWEPTTLSCYFFEHKMQELKDRIVKLSNTIHDLEVDNDNLTMEIEVVKFNKGI